MQKKPNSYFALIVFHCCFNVVSFCDRTLIKSQRKKVVSVIGAAAPRQDITGIYDVLNVSLVPPYGISLRQLGMAAACNELINPLPPTLSLSSSNVIFVQNYLIDWYVQQRHLGIQHHFHVFIKNNTLHLHLCLWWQRHERCMHLTRAPPS